MQLARNTKLLVLELCDASALWAKTSSEAISGDIGRLPLSLTLVE